MKKTTFSIILALFSIGAFSQVPPGYYDAAQGLNGASQKSALYQIIKDHNAQSYGDIWIHFEDTDPKPNGKVWDMYSDIPGGTPPYEYNFGDDQCGNYGGEGDCYNREHSFPKSWFDDASPMHNDLFQVVPTDGYVNGRRSNWPFGETNNATWTSQNGSKVGSNATSGYSGTIFEPIDAYKGDFARIYFYMATRYENLIASWENNSDNSDAALDGSSYPCYEEWYLNLLLDWHQNDPVSDKEIARNNEIYDIQNNRNPFVDHPEWVASIWGGVEAPVISNVSHSPQFPEENEAVTVTAQITDNASVSNAKLHWGFSNSNLSNMVTMTNSANNYSAQIPGQASGQVVYYRLEAIDNESNITLSAIYNYQVSQDAGFIALPFSEDFNDETLGIFYQVSVSGSEEYWHNDDFQDDLYAKMSNYNGSDNIENEDWMITPAINFDAYTNEKLNFMSAMKDYSDQSCFIHLMYSTNYSGSGDPNSANWTDISNQANWSPGEYTWTASGEIDLSSISGAQVYLAFKYDSQSGSGKTWQIDDINVSADASSNNPPLISDVQHSPNNPEAGQAAIVTATITDDGSVDEAKILWGLSSGSLSNDVTMSGSGANYTGQIPGQSEGQAVYYKVQATDDEDGTSNSSVYQYTIAGSANLPPVINNVNHNPSSPAGGEAVTVSAQITDDSGVESALVLWGLSAGSMSNIEEMTHSGDNYQIDIPGQNEGLTIYFKVQAFDEEGEMTESSTYNYTVETSGSTQTLPFFEDFESEDLGIFNQYSVSGAEQYWHNDDFEDNLYAKMSNYNGSDNLENEDWMITNAINFNNYSNEVLHFSSSMKDYNDNNTYIYIKYSSNYNGSSDPNAATWTDLSSLASWSPGEYEWVASGDIDLSNINGTEVYLAFQYISQDGTGKTWQIDDVSVSIEAANPAPEISNISQTPEAPDNEDIVTVSAQITDDGDIEIAELQYGTSPSQMNENIDMSASGSNFYGDIPVQDAGLTIYYRIMAEDNEGAVSYSSIYNYYVDLAEGLEEAKQETWSLYPNPAKDQIVINAAHAEILEINIFHSSGRFLYVDESYEANQVINLSGFAPGAYFIRIKNANKVETYRFIKQ